MKKAKATKKLKRTPLFYPTPQLKLVMQELKEFKRIRLEEERVQEQFNKELKDILDEQ